MIIERQGISPQIHETAYIAPNAVIAGDVTIGAYTSILFGAVVTADGGRVTIGDGCIIMETAVLRGTPKHPLVVENRTLVGPRAYLTGCRVEADCFLATGATVFNGARIGRESAVRINGIVHVNSQLEPRGLVPIGWIAVGDPAQIFPLSKHEEFWPIQRSMNFSETVWGAPRGTPQGDLNARYAKALTRHRSDRVLEDPSGGRP